MGCRSRNHKGHFLRKLVIYFEKYFEKVCPWYRCVHMCVYTYMYICMYMCIYVCIWIYTYICMFKHQSTCLSLEPFLYSENTPRKTVLLFKAKSQHQVFWATPACAQAHADLPVFHTSLWKNFMAHIVTSTVFLLFKKRQVAKGKTVHLSPLLSLTGSPVSAAICEFSVDSDWIREHTKQPFYDFKQLS